MKRIVIRHSHERGKVLKRHDPDDIKRQQNHEIRKAEQDALSRALDSVVSDTHHCWIAFEKQVWAWHMILEDPDIRRILFYGGARSGKTDEFAAWLIKEAGDVPGIRIGVFRAKRIDAFKTTFRTFLKILMTKKGELPAGWHKRESPYLALWNDNGSEIVIEGLDNNARVDKIMGDEFGHIYINEINQVPYAYINKLLTRLSQPIHSRPLHPHKFLGDCNPSSPSHWVHKYFLELVYPDNPKRGLPADDQRMTRTLHWTPLDNPYLQKDYINILKGLPLVQMKRMLLGLWCDNEGAVYEEFDEAIHVLKDWTPEDIPQTWEKIGSVDFGFTNPFCHLWGALDPDGRLYIYREHYAIEMTISAHCAVIKERERPGEEIYTRVADSADANSRAEMEANGLPTVCADKDIVVGIDNVRKRMKVQADGYPRLFILADCVNLIREMYEYKYPDSEEDRNAKEIPIDAFNHAQDALRYMVFRLDGAGQKRAGVL